ncbi:MAG: A24 family peptidase [Candidatus Dojkabacteria bacterium]
MNLLIEIIQLGLLFALGASLASFFNAQIYRLENPSKPNSKYSYCEGCHKKLAPHELIPVFSFLLLKGKCRKCGYKIPSGYFFTELLLGISLGLLFLFKQPIINYFITLLLAFLALYDLFYKSFPKVVMHLYLAAGLIYYLIQLYLHNVAFLTSGIPVALIITTLLLGINLIKKSFGLGDILVFLFLAFFLNIYQMSALFLISICLAATYAIILLLLKRVKKEHHLALVPFIYLGWMVVILLGNNMLQLILASWIPVW